MTAPLRMVIMYLTKLIIIINKIPANKVHAVADEKHFAHRAQGPGFAQREVLTLGLLYEMVVKKKQSAKQSMPIRQAERERDANPWKAESIVIYAAEQDGKTKTSKPAGIT